MTTCRIGGNGNKPVVLTTTTRVVNHRGMEIRSKAEFFTLWEQGVLGNRTQLWRDPAAAFASGVPNIGFRELRKVGAGAGKWEKVDRAQFWDAVHRWRAEDRSFIMDDGAPDEYRTLQGELCRTHRGLEGFLDVTARLPMRQAMAAGHMRHCSYATCNALLDRFMDPSSRDDLEALFDLYPDATIEFTCFSTEVGVFPGRRTLFWEVRNY